MNTNKIEKILQQLVSQSTGIEGAVLVSPQAQAITIPIGIDYNSTIMMAGMMLSLAKQTHEELSWQEIQQIIVQAEEGYVILISCYKDVFLLVQASNIPSNSLEKNINRYLKKLQPELIDLITAENNSW